MAIDKTTLEQAASPANITLEPVVALEPAEPVYILPPHPEAHIVSDSETVIPEEPTVAVETLEDLVQQAVAGIRGEIIAELQFERGGELNVKG